MPLQINGQNASCAITDYGGKVEDDVDDTDEVDVEDDSDDTGDGDDADPRVGDEVPSSVLP